ncbi:MAG: SpoIIIAH-like family protein [Clostridiaceae bacterium]|nr:SpoIIIAH-like family protein [Clostridiaceae bacterium]
MNNKQILVIALVLVIIAAGVLQFTYGKEGFSSRGDGEERLGEAVYVDNMTGEMINLTDGTTIPGNEDGGERTAITDDGSDYFVQARIDRESIRSKQKEELRELTSSTVMDKDISAKAQEEYLDLVKRSEVEATIESLVKQRGIEDVVVIFGSTGTIDLVVKADSLSQSETAQISDIVIRHSGVDMEDIHIKNMK